MRYRDKFKGIYFYQDSSHSKYYVDLCVCTFWWKISTKREVESPLDRGDVMVTTRQLFGAFELHQGCDKIKEIFCIPLSKILLINPSRWGRGITPIWIASHTAYLKQHSHDVQLFDCTFFEEWAYDEHKFNTDNKQYQQSDYRIICPLLSDNVFAKASEAISKCQPDIIFWNAISSHIHGEGEYANFEHGLTLLSNVRAILPEKSILVGAGIQLTGARREGIMHESDNLMDMHILGESEIVLTRIADLIDSFPAQLPKKHKLTEIESSLCSRYKCHRPCNSIIELSEISPVALKDSPSYDYSIFPENTLYRSYQGKIIRAVDYEFSRGCPYTCSYCVETVIQAHYGFTTKNHLGVLEDTDKYLRSKNLEIVKEEITYLVEKRGISMLRCQDTNFLSVNRSLVNAFAEWKVLQYPDLKLYVETRPESINIHSVNLLHRLNVCGVGMGIEMASEDTRASQLERFVDTEKIVRAFKLLREKNIRRTAYNIIGIPGQTEEEIKQTIAFNSLIDPDDITVAFYSAYKGTKQAHIGEDSQEYTQMSNEVDGQLRSNLILGSTSLSLEKLNYYKSAFVDLVSLESRKTR